MSKFDLSKPYRTRADNEASVIVGPDGFLYGWFMSGTIGRGKWTADGTYYPLRADPHFSPSPGSCQDLINVPEKRSIKVWINIYENDPGNSMGVVWKGSRVRADDACRGLPGRIACIEREITYTVGEGLKK